MKKILIALGSMAIIFMLIILSMICFYGNTADRFEAQYEAMLAVTNRTYKYYDVTSTVYNVFTNNYIVKLKSKSDETKYKVIIGVEVEDGKRDLEILEEE